ncbi:hypothetical protein Moror_3251 [Moniliophthora roreri MCA 2997]|uniref:Integrase core domain-containing protein n=2 Tax=Moniliophthora roreri TaxID=221103 RepID=V2XQE1_MONRO|nr:hypothetical protein Moror_3251 [Moniliophthora roreri MCA 2997]
MWHLDGHHKLIRWGIVIHGIIDGFCRTVVGLQASPNNKASTVLGVFAAAVQQYGWPSRMRGDHGGENKKVAVVMIRMCGLNRASFMWGKSTQNTHIERLWVECGAQFVCRWRAFFYRLEHLHRLDVKNPVHLWLLYYLFLHEINNDCEAFMEHWNHHPISGKGHNKSPRDMWLLGMIEHGVYNDRQDSDSDDEYPPDSDEDEQDIGIRNKYNAECLGGESEIDDDVKCLSDEDSKWEDEENAKIEVAYASQYNHKAIRVPQHQDPFGDNLELQAAFDGAMEQIDTVPLPGGWGIIRKEWGTDGYPIFEEIPAH